MKRSLYRSRSRAPERCLSIKKKQINLIVWLFGYILDFYSLWKHGGGDSHWPVFLYVYEYVYVPVYGARIRVRIRICMYMCRLRAPFAWSLAATLLDPTWISIEVPNQ